MTKESHRFVDRRLIEMDTESIPTISSASRLSQDMSRYCFKLIVLGRLVDEGRWLELPDRDAALGKAHQLAQALLSFGDDQVPWEDGALMVECEDGSELVSLPIRAAADRGVMACRH